jgi:serine/threonine protein kinase/TolB-like protein/Tfp pilus assembly protein PilF
MTPERWEQIKALFYAALERDERVRATFLDTACAGDPALRAEIEYLLASDERAGSFLEAAAFEPPPTIAGEERGEALVAWRIGAYQTLREIGRGGMGAVYLAARADAAYRKQVAIKVIQRGMATDGIIRSFRAERQILANLEHPNIARLLDGGTTADGLPYFVMEYVEGVPLNVFCDRRTLAIDERLDLFRTVCAAVHYAHQHGVIHRDLKPSNILVTVDGVPKLVDFGIAKVLHSDTSWPTLDRTTLTRPLTPAYASPEQVRAEAITPATDVYALGVMLYEVVTGHRPYRFRTQAPQEIERVICEQEPEKPSVVVRCTEEILPTDDRGAITITPHTVSQARREQPDKLRRRLAGDLDTIVLMALRKEPERRYASVDALAEDLRRHRAGLPISARTSTLVYCGAKFVRRNRAGVIAVTLSTVVIIGLTTIVGWRRPVTRILRRDSAAVETMRSAPISLTGDVRSLAVLPFKPLGDATADEFLAVGTADVLITRLTNLRQIVVRPASAVERYASAPRDPLEAGRELKVDAVLDGKVHRAGHLMRLTVQLLRVMDGRLLWGGTFEEEWTQASEVENAIAEKVAEALALTLTGEERVRLSQRGTTSNEAYQLYVKGRYCWNKRSPEEWLRKAINFFEQAIARDPNYALAYAGLADCYNLLANVTISGLSPGEMFPKAKAAAAKALSLDDSLAEAHASLGYARLCYDWDWAGAERELQQSLRLSPNYGSAHQWYGLYLSAMGRHDDAIREAKRALELDPASLIISNAVGFRLYEARRYDEAIEHLNKALELDGNFATVRYGLGLSYVQKGQWDKAIAELEKAVTLSAGNPTMMSALAYAYARAGHQADARKLLGTVEELSARRYVPPYNVALVLVGLEEHNRAFAWLERAYDERSTRLVLLAVIPEFDALRADSRFADLLRRIGLTR